MFLRSQLVGVKIILIQLVGFTIISYVFGRPQICYHYILTQSIIFKFERLHYNNAIMSAIASQITRLTIVYSTIYLGADQR